MNLVNGLANGTAAVSIERADVLTIFRMACQRIGPKRKLLKDSFGHKARERVHKNALCVDPAMKRKISHG